MEGEEALISSLLKILSTTDIFFEVKIRLVGGCANSWHLDQGHFYSLCLMCGIFLKKLLRPNQNFNIFHLLKL